MKDFYKLFNSGTSDGVKKEWITRRGGSYDSAVSDTVNADRKSRRAENADENFRTADDSKKTTARMQAIQAHKSAMVAHKKAAASRGREGIGRLRATKHHNERIAFHEGRISELKRKTA